MATEYRLSYTASEIDEKLGIIDGLATTTYVDFKDNEILSVIAGKEQLKPEFANSIEECTDTTKLYVLPDGYIYAYMKHSMEGGPLFTNLADPGSSDWLTGYRYNGSDALATSTRANACVSNYIPCKQGDIIRIKGVADYDSTAVPSGSTEPFFRIKPFDASFAEMGSGKYAYYMTKGYSVSGVAGKACAGVSVDENGVYSYQILQRYSSATVTGDPSFAGDIAYVRISGAYTGASAADVIITINEEIAYQEASSGYQWMSTGHAFVPADYEGRIVDLETDVATLKGDVADLKEISGSAAVVTSDVNWFAFGDSITQGYISYIKDDGTAGCKYIPSANQSWIYKVAELNGYTLTNYGAGGTGYAYGSPNASTTAREQVDAVDFTNCDLVTLAWGCNDWKYNGGAVGTVDDDKDTSTTPCASLKYVIEKIQSQNPLCKIIVLTPINVCYWGTFEGNYGLSHSFSNTGTLEDFFDAIVSVCKYYGVEYIDNTHSSIFNRVNIKSLLLDGVHPTPEAYVLMAKELAKKINFA